MHNVSQGFLDALRGPSIRMATRITASDGTTLWATDGGVEMDSRRGITRTATLTLIATDTLTLDAVYALVMTPTVEVTIHRGVYVNGVPEYVPLGVFSTDSATLGKDTISWSGSDRAKKISRARFTDLFTVYATSTTPVPLASAGEALLTSRWSFTQVDFSGVTDVLETPVYFEAGGSSDPWAKARDLFADFGYDLHFDGSGVAVATVVPDPATVPAAYDFGTDATNIVLAGNTSGTFDNTYNGVSVSGEGSNVDTPVRGTVWDDDPASPTYYQGGYGQVPMFHSTPNLKTQAACEKAARSLLARVKGRTQQLSITTIVNPALEPLDVVTATVNGKQSRFVIDKLKVPLKVSEAMSIQARETSVKS